MGRQAFSDDYDLVDGFTEAENNLRKTRADMAVMVDSGKAKVLVGQYTQLLYSLGDCQLAGLNLFQRASQPVVCDRFFVRGSIFIHRIKALVTNFEPAKTPFDRVILPYRTLFVIPGPVLKEVRMIFLHPGFQRIFETFCEIDHLFNFLFGNHADPLIITDITLSTEVIKFFNS